LPKLFIIAGCNGAGKTTASYTVLPELLGIKEFVNADEIAKGLSPFQPETVALEAGRIMLKRVNELLANGHDFAFETTLSTRSFVDLCKRAREKDYSIVLVFLWLNSSELAIERVKQRVSEGGHHISEDTILRRYKRGLFNFLNLYKDFVDEWYLLDNSEPDRELLARGKLGKQDIIFNTIKWQIIQQYE
jgi:predicted ABC-type ATPase